MKNKLMIVSILLIESCQLHADNVNNNLKGNNTHIVLIHGGLNWFDSSWDVLSKAETKSLPVTSSWVNKIQNKAALACSLLLKKYYQTLDFWGEWRQDGLCNAFHSYFKNYETCADIIQRTSLLPVHTFKWRQRLCGVAESDKNVAALEFIKFLKKLKSEHSDMQELVVIAYCCGGDVVSKATQKSEFKDLQGLTITVCTLDMPYCTIQERRPNLDYITGGWFNLFSPTPLITFFGGRHLCYFKDVVNLRITFSHGNNLFKPSHWQMVGRIMGHWIMDIIALLRLNIDNYKNNDTLKCYGLVLPYTTDHENYTAIKNAWIPTINQTSTDYDEKLAWARVLNVINNPPF